MTASTTALPSATLFSPDRAAACAGAVALITLLAFEALAVAAAMPAVATALGGLDLYALAFGGPLAASVPGMVLAGRWSDRHGALRATVWGLALFAGGLLVAGLAEHMTQLVVGRVLQGLGGGMLGVTLYVGMAQVVPPALHPRLFGLFATAWVVPGLVGPTVAAALVAHAGWRWVFLSVLLALPVVAGLLLPAYARLPRPQPPSALAPAANHSSLPMALLAAAGALLLHGAAGKAWPLLLAGLAAAWMAALRLLPAGSLRARPGLPAVIALRGLLAAAFATAEVFLPLLLTRDHGWSLMQAGAALSAGAVLWSVGSSTQARIQQPRLRRLGLVAGFAAVTAGIGLLALALALGLPAWTVWLCWPLTGLGIGLSFPMLSVRTLQLSAPAEQGRNASALQLCDALCTTAALALAGVLASQAHGPLGVLVLAAGLAGAGTLLARRAFADAV